MPSIVTLSPSATRIATTSALVCSPMMVAQCAEPGDMVGVQMRIDGLDQFEIQFTQQLAVAVDLLQHRIEDQRFAAGAAGQDITVGSRYAVEQLAKDHE